LLYEDYVWVSLGNAMKAKQSKGGTQQLAGRRASSPDLAPRIAGKIESPKRSRLERRGSCPPQLLQTIHGLSQRWAWWWRTGDGEGQLVAHLSGFKAHRYQGTHSSNLNSGKQPSNRTVFPGIQPAGIDHQDGLGVVGLCCQCLRLRLSQAEVLRVDPGALQLKLLPHILHQGAGANLKYPKLGQVQLTLHAARSGPRLVRPSFAPVQKPLASDSLKPERNHLSEMTNQKTSCLTGMGSRKSLRRGQ
jgi:hypothetical protein